MQNWLLVHYSNHKEVFLAAYFLRFCPFFGVIAAKILKLSPALRTTVF